MLCAMDAGVLANNNQIKVVTNKFLHRRKCFCY